MKPRVSRSNRTSDMLHIQQQISHYHGILHAKADIDTSCPSVIQPSRLRSKFYNEVERQRLIENSKLVRKLTEIKNSKGLMHEGRYKNRPRGTSLQSEHRLLENQKQRLRENEILLVKLQSVRPSIGTHDQWDKDFEQFKSNQRKLSRVNLELSNLEDGFYKTYADITSKKPLSRKKLVSQHSKRSTTANVSKNKLCHCQCEQVRNVPEQYASDTMDNKGNELTQNHQGSSSTSQIHHNTNGTHRRKRRSHKKKNKNKAKQDNQKSEEISGKNRAEQLCEMYES